MLGANDGILSTSSLVLGVAAAHATHRNLLVAGMAGLVAGAMSMAAREYVSVHSQAVTERADLDIERTELKTDNKGEHKELATIYIARGLDPALAKQVAQQLMARDALGAHASDELGISKTLRPRPIQAALSSAGSFALGALMPLLVTAVAPAQGLIICLFTGLARTSGRFSGTRARGRSDDRCNAGDVLGWIGYGNDRRHRMALWSSCLRSSKWGRENLHPHLR